MYRSRNSSPRGAQGETLVLVPEALRRDMELLWKFIASSGVNRLFVPYVALQHLAEVAGHPGAARARLREL